jgi:hypothetical protein
MAREARVGVHFNWPDLEGAELEDQVGLDGGGGGGIGYCTVHLLVTTAMVSEARAHFNCPDLEGAEVEDQVDLDVGD